MVTKKVPLIYQFKITLQDIEPAIWRRFQIPEDATLKALHRVLQIVMGWEECHLHDFQIARRTYSVPDVDDEMNERTVIDEAKTPLKDVLTRVGTSFLYVYDFGDDWRHDLLFEAILLPETGTEYPRCIEGVRRCPPEDVGGPPGYEGHLEALRDPSHEEHGAALEWRGPFDPETFSLAEVNRELIQTFRRNRRPLGRTMVGG